MNECIDSDKKCIRDNNFTLLGVILHHICFQMFFTMSFLIFNARTSWIPNQPSTVHGEHLYVPRERRQIIHYDDNLMLYCIDECFRRTGKWKTENIQLNSKTVRKNSLTIGIFS